MESPAFLCFVYVYVQYISSSLASGETISPHDVISLLTAQQLCAGILFCIHYVFRGLIFPFLGSDPSRPLELKVALSGAFFCIMNGIIIAYELCYGTKSALRFLPDFVYRTFTSIGLGTQEIISSSELLVGIVVFFTGWFINQQSDHILRNLRKGDPPGSRRTYD